jgi:hypothetical protein
VVRGVSPNQRAQDGYALGTLVAQAVGCQATQLVHDDGEKVEAQARGALLPVHDRRSEVPPYLRGIPQLRQLFTTIQRYRHPVPQARPAGVGELRTAIADATDLVGLAETLRPDNPEAALEVLSWAGEADTGRLVRCLGLAADICTGRGDVGAALGYLDRAVRLMPDYVDIRRARADALWTVLEATPLEAAPARLPELIADLEFVDQRRTERSARWRRRLAEAYRRDGDRFAEAEALYGVVDIEPKDLASLRRYGGCLKDLGRRGDVGAVVRTGKRRADNLAAAGEIDEQTRQRWHAEFDALLD